MTSPVLHYSPGSSPFLGCAEFGVVVNTSASRRAIPSSARAREPDRSAHRSAPVSAGQCGGAGHGATRGIDLDPCLFSCVPVRAGVAGDLAGRVRRITRGEKMKAKLVEHAIDMLEAAKATHDPAKIAKAQALLDMVRGWV